VDLVSLQHQCNVAKRERVAFNGCLGNHPAHASMVDAFV
jgi:hypothetical protein